MAFARSKYGNFSHHRNFATKIFARVKRAQGSSIHSSNLPFLSITLHRFQNQIIMTETLPEMGSCRIVSCLVPIDAGERNIQG